MGARHRELAADRSALFVAVWRLAWPTASRSVAARSLDSSGSGCRASRRERAAIRNGISSADISSTLPWLWLAMTSRSSVNGRGIGQSSPRLARWYRVRSAMPARASRSISANSASSNGAPSAVAWISTIRRFRSKRNSRRFRLANLRHSRGSSTAPPATTPQETAATLSRNGELASDPAAIRRWHAWWQRYIAAGHCGGAGAAIGLQDIAIDADLALAELGPDR